MPDTRSEVQAAMKLRDADRPDQAEETLRRALKRDPTHPGANQVMAIVLSEQGRYDQAIFFIERAIAAEPSFSEFYVTLAAIKSNTPDLDGAVRALRRALEIDPDNANALVMLATALVERGRPAEAEAIARRAIALNGGPNAANPLARALLESARADEALSVLTEALRLRPHDPELLSLACMISNYITLAPARAADLHRTYGRAVTPPRAGAALGGSALQSADRRLRIGLLSPDFRAHSVAAFIEPFLAAHDRARTEVLLYHTNPVADATTHRLRALASEFRHFKVSGDAAIAAAIQRDGIDILVELSGHTSGHRLPLLARRLAPIQVSYLGYPNTTGVPALDFRLVDRITDPPGSDAFSTERLIRLPGCFLCYHPPDAAPGVAPRPSTLPPSHPASPFTFGSFNNPAKISPETLDAWSRILTAVPGSCLILKGRAFADPDVRARAQSLLAARGVDPSRVEPLAMFPGRDAHLAAYHRLDLALDTFPYCGTATTCESLWMGVPVITRAGETHASRVGASLLTAAGLPELIASSPDDFVRLAVSLASDPARLSALSRSLRDRLRASPLCDAAPHTRALEAALRDLWRARCAADQ